MFLFDFVDKVRRVSRGYCQVTLEDVIRVFLRHTPTMRTSISLYRCHRFPVEIMTPHLGRESMTKVRSDRAAHPSSMPHENLRLYLRRLT